MLSFQELCSAFPQPQQPIAASLEADLRQTARRCLRDESLGHSPALAPEGILLPCRQHGDPHVFSLLEMCKGCYQGAGTHVRPRLLKNTKKNLVFWFGVGNVGKEVAERVHTLGDAVVLPHGSAQDTLVTWQLEPPERKGRVFQGAFGRVSVRPCLTGVL